MAALNIPSGPSLGGLGRSLSRPPLNNTLATRTANRQPKGAFDSLDINKIGKGYLMTEGSYHRQFGVKKYSGLKGQLMKLKKAGKFTTTKNLSTENIKQMHDMIADRIKKKRVGSQVYISRQDKMAIMKESKKLVRTKDSHFTWQDRKDLKKTVETIQKQYKDRILHRTEANTTVPNVNPAAPGLDEPKMKPAPPLDLPIKNENLAPLSKIVQPPVPPVEPAPLNQPQ